MSLISNLNNNKNFNNKYYVLWFKIDLGDKPHQPKLDIVWIKSWQRRYLVIGHLIPNGIAAKIGLQYGDRLGYLNGMVAPKFSDLENILKCQRILHMGILRKHSAQTLMMVNWIRKKRATNHKSQVDNNTSIIHNSINQLSKGNFSSDSTLKHFFVSNSGYKDLKDSQLYENGLEHLKSSFNYVKDEHKHSTPNQRPATASFLENKENFEPQIFKDDRFDVKNFGRSLKECEIKKSKMMISYKKGIFFGEPDNQVITKIDTHVKRQRVLRNLGINNNTNNN